MRSLNTKLVLSALGVVLLAMPSLAQSSNRQPPDHTARSQTASMNEVVLDGRVIGADPDPHIRGELLRDYGSNEAD